MAKTKNPNETNEQKLVRLAEVRVNRMLSAIGGLGNLGKLKPTVKQRDAVFTVLSAAMNTAHDRWSGKEGAKGGFKLS